MTQTVVYFTAGQTPTSGELADIAALNAASENPYKVLVVNGGVKAVYGEPNRLIPCDLVAGTVPTIYNAKPVLDPDAIPPSGLGEDQAVVTDGQKITGVTGTGTVANIAVDPDTKAVTVTLTAS